MCVWRNRRAKEKDDDETGKIQAIELAMIVVFWPSHMVEEFGGSFSCYSWEGLDGHPSGRAIAMFH